MIVPYVVSGYKQAWSVHMGRFYEHHYKPVVLNHLFAELNVKGQDWLKWWKKKTFMIKNLRNLFFFVFQFSVIVETY